MALGGTAFVYVAVILVDPYDTLFLSPPFERAPVVTNQRFSFPALARNPKFDSAIFGTSTSRLLRPEQLNGLLGASFVNLSMNSGTPYEQSQIFNLFARHHPRARAIIFAIDNPWCGSEDGYAKFTFRRFPPWLYDEDRWNDFLHLLDFMISSDITERDENYWDILHHSLAVAERLGELITAGVRDRRGRARLFDYLRPADFE